jgi:hypothetical protein
LGIEDKQRERKREIGKGRRRNKENIKGDKFRNK